MVLSDRLWRARFGADPSLVGRTVELMDRPFTVIGVLPPDFRGLQRGLVNDVCALRRDGALDESLLPRKWTVAYDDVNGTASLRYAWGTIITIQ